jgi:hypothetical protein
VKGVKQIGFFLAVVLVVAAIATEPSSGARPRISGTAAVAMPAIDLGALFGNEDENEPDENEPNENGGDGRATVAGHHRPRHRASRPFSSRSLLLGVLGIAVVLAGASLLTIRLIRRYRAWKQHVADRARAGMRRMGVELIRARERRFRP